MWILGSHNSWSYLPPKKWWMKLIAFTAKCQSKTIQEQYSKYNVRCFDLRIRFDKNDKLVIAHGIVEYDYSEKDLFKDLTYINNRNDCFVRVLHEVRTKKAYTEKGVKLFDEFCTKLEKDYPNIQFYNGKNLYNYKVDHYFDSNIIEDGKYASVCSPKLIDDWIPWIYARLNNKKNLKKGTSADILHIDFVNYGY